MQATYNTVRKYGPKLAAFGSLAVPALVFADTDPSVAVLASITTTQTSALAVAAGLLTMIVAVWGAIYLKRFFGGK